MKKVIVITLLSGFILAAISSCNKCYNCTKTITTKNVAGLDSSYVLQSDYCRGGKEGAGNNLEETIKDIEKNGYKCTVK